MKRILCAAAVAAGTVLSAAAANAAIIDNGTYTTDTSLGLDYLDVGLIADTYASFSAGVSYGGKNWVLATPAQLASTWSAITGLSLTNADILSGDNNMGFAATNALVSLFDGVPDGGGELIIGDYASVGYYNFIDGGQLAVHTGFDDSHFQATTSGTAGAWLVTASGAVSEVPEPLTVTLFGAGLAGVAALRRRKAKSA